MEWMLVQRAARPLTLAVMAATLVAGCGSDGVSPDAARSGAKNDASVLSNGQPAPRSVVSQAEAGVIAPKDAKYTIVCMTFPGPSHVQQATISKQNLINATGHKEFYVVHEEAVSTLYYGYYRSFERSVDPVEAKRANADLEYVRSLVDGEGNRLFTKSLFVPLPQPDVAGPAEYDLTKIDADKSPDDPNRRYWSLAIADYTGDALDEQGRGRKQLAVESVIEARKKGYEAYYYNGPNTSTVLIGAWPRRAIREQDANEAKTNGDNGQEIIVSNAPIPQPLLDQIKQSGRNVTVVQPKVVIDDPSMQATRNEFKQYVLNGDTVVDKITDPRTGKTIDRPKETFLVEIPTIQKANQMLAEHSSTAEPEPATGAGVQNPFTSGSGTSGGGRLRSVAP